MKIISIDSYKTIEEYYRVIFAKLSDFKSQIFFSDWYIYPYVPSLINCMFHKDWTSSFRSPIVYRPKTNQVSSIFIRKITAQTIQKAQNPYKDANH